jgi:hypothetical protein
VIYYAERTVTGRWVFKERGCSYHQLLLVATPLSPPSRSRLQVSDNWSINTIMNTSRTGKSCDSAPQQLV